MKVQVLILNLWSFISSTKQEKRIDLGNGESLTFGFSRDLEDRDTPKDDFDEETWMILASNYDPTLIPDHTDHDCNTIREFEAGKLVPEYLNRNRMKKWEKKGNEKRKVFDNDSKWKDDIVKYNYAYGIPVVGQTHFADESLKRACYLVRFLLADNEGFRRMAFLSRMYIFGEKGGICCPANVGNPGLSCPCALSTTFPIRQITTPSHEIGHWMLAHVFPAMVKTGYLKLPEFDTSNNPQYIYTKPYGICDNQIAEQLSRKAGDLYDFVWNSIEEGTNKQYQCTWHHYFMHWMHKDFLSLESGGQPKEKARKEGRKQRPNMFNIFERLWPCNNSYLSVCEDAAYGFTKGMAQRFIIGKSDPEDRSKMICRNDIDKTEIEKVEELSPIPSEDDSFARLSWEGIFKDEGFSSKYQSGQDKCYKTIQKGGSMGYGWVKDGIGLSGIKKGKFYPDVIRNSLKDSNEFAWWLRKCCASTAKLN